MAYRISQNYFTASTRGVDLGELGRSWPPENMLEGQSMFWPPPPWNGSFVHSQLLLDNSASFISSRMKDLCQKMKGKTRFFRGAYRLSGTGIFDCLEIIDVGCNMKQFDGLTWLTLTLSLTHHILWQISPLASTLLVGWQEGHPVQQSPLEGPA